MRSWRRRRGLVLRVELERGDLLAQWIELGIQGVDPQLVEMGRTYGMSPFTLFRRVILPGALPSIFTGLRYALGIMWLTLIVAE